MKKNRGKVCMFQEKYLSLQCQNMVFDYPVSFHGFGHEVREEQDSTDTTPPLQSHLRMAFAFLFVILLGEGYNEISLFDSLTCN